MIIEICLVRYLGRKYSVEQEKKFILSNLGTVKISFCSCSKKNKKNCSAI